MANYSLKINLHQRKLTVSNKTAEEWFHRGLNWLFAFHHEEAINCFETCITLDGNCLLAYWGIAYANSPNYNFHKDVGYYVVSSQEGGFPCQKKAVGALNTAMLLMQGDCHYTAEECALLNALRLRFSTFPPSPYAHTLEIAYKNAMEEVYSQYPLDSEVAFALADAIMVLRPWQLWDIKTGEMTTEAHEAKTILEDGLRRWPDHPGLCHLYVHLMEMSPTPELAIPGPCTILRNLDTDAGHLIHMASHIDVLVGDYKSAVDANKRALDADDRCIQHGKGGSAGSFYLGYISHDCHMLVYAAMLGGMEEEARMAAERMLTYINEDTLVKNPERILYQEPFVPQTVHVLLRFGRWKEILQLPFPKSQSLMAYTWATLLYARSIAFAVLGKIQEALEEEAKYLAACKHKEIPRRRLHNNLVSDLLEVKRHMLRGEIEYRQQNYVIAFGNLRKAVGLEDALPYDEPWGIMQPCRHALGALLLEQGHIDEALDVYNKDLMPGRHPGNPWSLRGVISCLQRKVSSDTGNLQETNRELAHRQSQLENQQKRMGISLNYITHSCMCAGQKSAQL